LNDSGETRQLRRAATDLINAADFIDPAQTKVIKHNLDAFVIGFIELGGDRKEKLKERLCSMSCFDDAQLLFNARNIVSSIRSRARLIVYHGLPQSRKSPAIVTDLLYAFVERNPILFINTNKITVRQFVEQKLYPVVDILSGQHLDGSEDTLMTKFGFDRSSFLWAETAPMMMDRIRQFVTNARKNKRCALILPSTDNNNDFLYQCIADSDSAADHSAQVRDFMSKSCVLFDEPHNFFTMLQFVNDDVRQLFDDNLNPVHVDRVEDDRAVFLLERCLSIMSGEVIKEALGLDRESVPTAKEAKIKFIKSILQSMSIEEIRTALIQVMPTELFKVCKQSEINIWKLVGEYRTVQVGEDTKRFMVVQYCPIICFTATGEDLATVASSLGIELDAIFEDRVKLQRNGYRGLDDFTFHLLKESDFKEKIGDETHIKIDRYDHYGKATNHGHTIILKGGRRVHPQLDKIDWCMPVFKCIVHEAPPLEGDEDFVPPNIAVEKLNPDVQEQDTTSSEEAVAKSRSNMHMSILPFFEDWCSGQGNLMLEQVPYTQADDYGCLVHHAVFMLQTFPGCKAYVSCGAGCFEVYIVDKKQYSTRFQDLDCMMDNMKQHKKANKWLGANNLNVGASVAMLGQPVSHLTCFSTVGKRLSTVMQWVCRMASWAWYKSIDQDEYDDMTIAVPFKTLEEKYASRAHYDGALKSITKLKEDLLKLVKDIKCPDNMDDLSVEEIDLIIRPQAVKDVEDQIAEHIKVMKSYGPHICPLKILIHETVADNLKKAYGPGGTTFRILSGDLIAQDDIPVVIKPMGHIKNIRPKQLGKNASIGQPFVPKLPDGHEKPTMATPQGMLMCVYFVV
jgi:hypothetical protein